MSRKDLKKDIISNPRKYVGQLMWDNLGNVYVVEGVDSSGIKAAPIMKWKAVGG